MNKKKQPKAIPLPGDQKGYEQFTLNNGLKSNVKYSSLDHFKKMNGEENIMKVVIIGNFYSDIFLFFVNLVRLIQKSFCLLIIS